MEQVCFTMPVLAGKTAAARAFLQEVDGGRKAEFADSERRIGITKESWYLQQTAQGDLLIVYLESSDAASSLQQFSNSQDAFDQWFKRNLAEVTGVDLNSPPPWPLSEQVSSYAS